MILYIILLLLFIYAYFLTRKDLGCFNSPNLNFFKRCEMVNNAAIQKIMDSSDPTNIKVSTLVDSYVNRVFWRPSFIFSLVIVGLLFLIFCKICASTEVKIFISVIISTFILYFMHNFYAYHIGDQVKVIIQKELGVI